MDEQDSTGRDGREFEDDALKQLLASGMTYAEAGAVLGMSERTVRRRMSDDNFAAEVSRRRGEFVGALAGQVVALGPEALGVMRGLMHSGTGPVRVRAAWSLLTLGNQLRHAQELEDRLLALERKADVDPNSSQTS